MRERYSEITERGAEVVAIGTGSQRYAASFVADEDVPFPVLVDDDADAANAASVQSVSFLGLFHPKTWAKSKETRAAGHKVHKAGKRVTQLGATFVIAPGDEVRYEHLDDDSTDHAPLDEVLAALP